jgi:hypothetical protein
VKAWTSESLEGFSRCGAKGEDAGRVFTSWIAIRLDPAAYIDCPRSDLVDGGCDIIGIKPAREYQSTFRGKRLRERPIECMPTAANHPFAVRIHEHDVSGHPASVLHIGGGSYADRLECLRKECPHVLRGFGAMELNVVERFRGQDGAALAERQIHHHRDSQGCLPNEICNSAGGLELNAPRRTRPKVDTDCGSAGIERNASVFDAGHSADLDMALADHLSER